jgi:hypothetical protein
MKLFPKRKPYKKGYFPVSEGHKLYYALYGNPKGTLFCMFMADLERGAAVMHTETSIRINST